MCFVGPAQPVNLKLFECLALKAFSNWTSMVALDTHPSEIGPAAIQINQPIPTQYPP